MVLLCFMFCFHFIFMLFCLALNCFCFAYVGFIPLSNSTTISREWGEVYDLWPICMYAHIHIHIYHMYIYCTTTCRLSRTRQRRQRKVLPAFRRSHYRAWLLHRYRYLYLNCAHAPMPCWRLKGCVAVSFVLLPNQHY